MQQANVLREQTGKVVSQFVGDMGLDFWSKAAWRGQLEQPVVLVMTYQIMLNILSCGFIKVLDRALRAALPGLPALQITQLVLPAPSSDLPHAAASTQTAAALLVPPARR